MNNRPALGLMLASSLLITGCTKKATGQTVAVVNGEEVTVGELNAELASANVPASADKEAVRAQVLQGIVNRRLLAQQAREQGLDKSPEFVAKQRQLTEQLLIELSTNRSVTSSQLPDQRAIDAFIAAHPGMFRGREIMTLQQVQFAAPTRADILEKFKQTRSMDELIATLTAAQIPYQSGQSKLDSATLPQNLLQTINKLPPNEPFIIPQGGQMVANVIVARQSAPTVPEQNRRLALAQMRKQEVEKKFAKSLEQLRASAKIEYQPGYAPKAEQGAPTKS